MPFIIMTQASKEKSVADVLQKRGTRIFRSSKAKGMLVCQESLPADIRSLPGVVGVLETSAETVQRLLSLEEKREEKEVDVVPVKPGEAVIVMAGPYTGFAGIVREIGSDGRILVHLSVYGKGVPVRLESENLKKEQIGESWR